MSPASPRPPAAGTAALIVGALGVVFGDIGTSPLYAMQSVFAAQDGPPTRDDVYGPVSLVFWTVTLVVSVKYVPGQVYVVRTLWGKPLRLVLAGAAAFLTVDLALFAACLTKVPHGGWVWRWRSRRACSRCSRRGAPDARCCCARSGSRRRRCA